MKLLTANLKRKIPPLYTTENTPVEEKQIVCKFFCPWNQWTWYVVEGSPEGDDVLFFGYVVGLEPEWGYFSLKELEAVRHPSGLKIERDMYFEPRPFSTIKQEIGYVAFS